MYFSGVAGTKADAYPPMKSNYIGTQLEPDQFLAFGVRAAESGSSKSAILRDLVEEFLAKRAAKSKGLNLRKGGKV